MAEWLKEGLKKKAAGVEPSAGSWERLSHRLQAEGIAREPRAPRRWRLGLEVLAVCLLFASLVVFTQGRSPSEPTSSPHVEEIAVEGDPHSNARAFSTEVHMKAPPLRGGDPPLATAARLLRAFGYNLEAELLSGVSPGVYRADGHTLYRGEEILLEWVRTVGKVSTSADGSDFIVRLNVGPFLHYPENNKEYWLMSDGLRVVDENLVAASRFQAPVFVGERLLHTLQDDLGRVTVVELLPGCLRIDEVTGDCPTFEVGREIFTIQVEPGAPFALAAYGQQWVLEVDGDIYLNGQGLRRKGRYDRVFGWRLIDGKPFYFAERRGQTRLVYDGGELDQHYDEVLQGMCCDLESLNPSYGYDSIRFNARRGDQWYHVVLESPGE